MAGEGTRNPADTLRRCCRRFVGQVGVMNPTTCPDCGDTLYVRDRMWHSASVLVPRETVERAKAAMEEVAQVRACKWPGDKRWEKYGLTLLDRFEGLARVCLGGDAIE